MMQWLLPTVELVIPLPPYPLAWEQLQMCGTILYGLPQRSAARNRLSQRTRMTIRRPNLTGATYTRGSSALVVRRFSRV